MIKRAEQKDNIKRLICISREVKGIALNKIDFIFGCQFLFECGNIGIGKFKSRDFITLTSKVEAVFTCTCANVEYLVAIFQIFFYIVNGSLKFNLPIRLSPNPISLYWMSLASSLNIS